ncbi:hypothetical protein MXB_1716 [Myxobolus squamalis]|nr:hypothetical protein MXB_1716 [Myxobolus squamalis]
MKTSGFSGRGFKFDDHECLHSSESKKMIKWTFGWQDSGDEAEAEDKVLKKIEHDIDKAFSSRPKATGTKQESSSVDKDKMELAQSIATKLNEKLKTSNTSSETYGQLVKPVPKSKPLVGPGSANMDIAKNVAEKIGMKLNYEAMAPSSRPDTVRKLAIGEVYFEEIDVNDFPQLARQRITAKETLDAISEMADCSLTIKGTYCPSGKPIDFTDRRLHLMIEGNTEFKVQIAKAEVKRVIKEESVKSDYAFIQPSSRYKIT